VVAEATPEPELVVTDPGTEPAAAAPETLLADVTEVETVAAPTTVGPAPVELAAVVPATNAARRSSMRWKLSSLRLPERMRKWSS
jgi:hypothetical protein